jgi:hypothetical protein
MIAATIPPTIAITATTIGIHHLSELGCKLGGGGGLEE